MYDSTPWQEFVREWQQDSALQRSTTTAAAAAAAGPAWQKGLSEHRRQKRYMPQPNRKSVRLILFCSLVVCGRVVIKCNESSSPKTCPAATKTATTKPAIITTSPTSTWRAERACRGRVRPSVAPPTTSTRSSSRAVCSSRPK